MPKQSPYLRRALKEQYEAQKAAKKTSAAKKTATKKAASSAEKSDNTASKE